MTALRPSLLRDRPETDFYRLVLSLSLALSISAWLHLAFFIIWESFDNTGLFRLDAPWPPPPLELAVELEEAPADPDPPMEAEPPVEAEDDPAAAENSATEEEALALAAALTRAPLLPGEEAESPPVPPLTAEPEAPRSKSYKTAVRSAVNAKFLMPQEASFNFRPGRLVVSFTIGRDGSLLRFVVEESSGNAVLDHAGLEALRAAPPFPPFPPEFSTLSQLDMVMNFDFVPDRRGGAATEEESD